MFASAAAMDKEFTKKLAVAEGIPIGPYAVLRDGMTLTEEDKERLGLPVFVKPSRAGSSFGITKVSDWADLEAAIVTARQIDPKVLVEAAIVGREIECGVLEGEAGGAPGGVPAGRGPGGRPTATSTTSRPSTSATPASTTSRPACRTG